MTSSTSTTSVHKKGRCARFRLVALGLCLGLAISNLHEDYFDGGTAFYDSSGLSTVAKRSGVAACTGNTSSSSTLPVSHLPSGKDLNNSYNFTVGICAIVKDVEAYLEEWIDYHMLGMQFAGIYLYDNSENFELKTWYDNSRDHPIYHKVHIFHAPTRQNNLIQRTCYNKCVQRFGKDPNGPHHDYMALFDLDEFMVLQQPHLHHDIRGVLQEYLVPYGGALTVNWMLFGTSNHTLFTPIPVTKRFQYRERSPHSNIKSIVKSLDFDVVRNPHAVELIRQNKDNQNGGTMVRTTKFPGAIHKSAAEIANSSKSSSLAAASDRERPSKILLLYHYRYLSTKEYLTKRCSRGTFNHDWCTTTTSANTKDHHSTSLMLRKDTPDHIQPRPGVVLDDKAWSFLTTHVPKYRFYDNELVVDFG